MVAHQLAAVAVCAALAASPVGADLRADPSPTARPAGLASTQAERPGYVPCPVLTVPGAASVPPAPSLPPGRDPAAPVIGGEALGTAGLTLPPGVQPPAPLPARSWLVADLDSGAVLGACGPHERHPPASVQKLLLAATVLSRLDPAQVIEVTKADMDFEAGSSAVGLLVGGRYTVETLWLGLMLNSGNDAANVLARLGGGPAGVAGTMEAMNAEARRLGAYDTHAVTPSGLDGPGQATSAYDLALIARACFAREDFRRYTATLRAQIPAQPPKNTQGFQIQNDNQLLTQYPGALGGKTGFTDLARHTYVGLAERGGRRLVVTILSAETRPTRTWQQGAALLDWAFGLPRDATVGRLVSAGEVDEGRQASAPQPRAGAVAGLAARRALGANGVTVLAVAAGGMLVAATAAAATAVGLTRRRRRRRPSVR